MRPRDIRHMRKALGIQRLVQSLDWGTLQLRTSNEWFMYAKHHDPDEQTLYLPQQGGDYLQCPLAQFPGQTLHEAYRALLSLSYLDVLTDDTVGHFDGTVPGLELPCETT